MGKGRKTEVEWLFGSSVRGWCWPVRRFWRLCNGVVLANVGSSRGRRRRRRRGLRMPIITDAVMMSR